MRLIWNNICGSYLHDVFVYFAPLVCVNDWKLLYPCHALYINGFKQHQEQILIVKMRDSLS